MAAAREENGADDEGSGYAGRDGTAEKNRRRRR
jgi:hypothetical protein